jgi:DNA-binding response OmpR family regulator
LLVVDDDPGTVDALAHLLRAEGFIVEVALDGDAALEACEQHQPDLVLADIYMPRTNGIALLEKLRALHPRTKVVMMTVDGSRGLSTRTTTGGAADHLVKPLDVEVLLARIHRALAEP